VRGRAGGTAPAWPADRPTPRTDSNSVLAHRQLLAKRTRGKIDVYFIGNSITRRWGATDYPDFLANWRANFFGWNAADFGWGADGIEHMLWRLEHGELDGVNPKVVVILAGTNNVGRVPGGDAKVADVTRGLRALVDLARRKAPGATIVLTGIFPRNDSLATATETNREIARINENVARMADGRSVRYVNINDRLADANGMLFPGMTVDGLHLSLKGYQAWADALKPIFRELLGPPAATDQAPPPTGDPSKAGSRADERVRSGSEEPSRKAGSLPSLLTRSATCSMLPAPSQYDSASRCRMLFGVFVTGSGVSSSM
jgi:lysophospholipase L1-like esterase